MQTLELLPQPTTRLTLVQTLGLKSRYLRSCLVRTKALLAERNYQKGLSLLRHRGEDDYQSVLDYLLVLFMPAIRPAVLAFYDGQGPRLIDLESSTTIAALDEALAARLSDLLLLYGELQCVDPTGE